MSLLTISRSGWKQSLSSYNEGQNTTFCMKKPHLLVQDSNDHHLWQWMTIWQPQVQRFLQGAGDKESIFLPWTSTSKQLDWSYKLDFTQTNQNPTWGGRRSMAWRASRSFIGLQNDGEDTNRWDILQASVWNRNNNSCGSWSVKSQKNMLWQTQQWRGPQASSGLLTRDQRRRNSENGPVLGEDDKVLQSEGKAEAFQSWRYGSTKGFTSHQRSKWREVRPQLGRSIQGHPLFKKRELLLGGCKWETFAPFY